MSLLLPIDHFVVLVNDLEVARQSFVEAGFTATAITRHSAAMGTANSCIMLQDNYIELMGMVADTPANEGWRALLAAGPGLKGIALASDDIDVTSKRLSDKGIVTESPRHFSRETAEGELRFSVIRLPRDLTPGLQCIYCRHHTPELLWTPQTMRHANGATRILAASVPGVSGLQPLEEEGGTLPIGEAAAGSITIEAREPISQVHADAIAATTGIRIQTRHIS
ncbi:VOC family protein [Aliihoeflea sp. PC F10.4]